MMQARRRAGAGDIIREFADGGSFSDSRMGQALEAVFGPKLDQMPVATPQDLSQKVNGTVPAPKASKGAASANVKKLVRW